ncbi:hypothetical protein EVAR_82176_1 [Eumeta japonica]|uniref:Uncharacterized protein n=1 Tax=Eumeta variegata TaxID=151549 RepID=A0A4C1U213_EUMVA|nr:hypothetical protein EVAR_82176_1 [Eumeta japonica]
MSGTTSRGSARMENRSVSSACFQCYLRWRASISARRAFVPGPKRTEYVTIGSIAAYIVLTISGLHPRAISVLPMRMTGTSNFSFLVSTIALVFDGANLNFSIAPVPHMG